MRFVIEKPNSRHEVAVSRKNTTAMRVVVESSGLSETGVYHSENAYEYDLAERKLELVKTHLSSLSRCESIDIEELENHVTRQLIREAILEN